MQVPYLIGDGQICGIRFGFGIVPTGVDAIFHTASNIGREAVSDDQDFTLGWTLVPSSYACKGFVEEGSLWLGRAHLFRNDQLTDEMFNGRMFQTTALDGLQSVSDD